MFEITRKNCYKCDLETIIANDSQYFWINLKDFEAETERNWQNIFNKYGNSSTLKYRKELTPNIQFQPDRIFTRNDLFEKIIKSCKATNAEFLMLKEKLGLCPYEVICDEKELILMPKIQDDIEEFKKENKEPMKIKSPEESTKKAVKIKSPEESMETKSPEDKNTTDWYDKSKFKKISAIVISNKFNHKTRIGKFKYNDIRDLVDNINKNTISEKLARKNLNALNKLRNAEIKNKHLSSNQKELLELFDDLSETISNNSNNTNNSNNNENESESDNENDHDNVNDNDNENESESDNENDNDNVNESESES